MTFVTCFLWAKSWAYIFIPLHAYSAMDWRHDGLMINEDTITSIFAKKFIAVVLESVHTNIDSAHLLISSNSEFFFSVVNLYTKWMRRLLVVDLYEYCLPQPSILFYACFDHHYD